MTDLHVDCCVIKIQNKLKHNFSRSVYLLQVVKWFQSFQRFELWRVIFPTGVENWLEFAGVSNNRGFEKSGVKLQC